MIEGSIKINLRMEAQEWLIDEQQKSINELKTMLLKVLENSQKNLEDKARKSFEETLLFNKEEKEDEGEKPLIEEGEDFNFIVDPHTEKMQKMQNQLEPLMHRKDLQETEITRPSSVEWESTPFPERNKPLKLESYD